MQFLWLLASLIMFALWALCYLSLKSPKKRREIIRISAWTSLLALFEPFFVPEYWTPPSIADLALKTGFDLESFIFAFSIGGIAAVVYDLVFKTKPQERPAANWQTVGHHYVLLSTPLVVLIIYLATNLNPIYAILIGLYWGSAATLICRWDLKQRMLMSGFFFLLIYIAWLKIILWIYPNAVEQIWNLPALSGVLISGVPLEELHFAAGFGFLWSSLYEHLIGTGSPTHLSSPTRSGIQTGIKRWMD